MFEHFFVVKKQYNIALIVLSVLFFISLIFDNNIETFNTNQQKEIEYTKENAPQSELPKSSQTNQPQTTKSDSEKDLKKEKNSTEKRHYHMLSVKEFSKLFFVLNFDQQYVDRQDVWCELKIVSYSKKLL